MLEFLSPTILWGLSLLSIPVILHFLKNINPRIIPFSSISFFKDLQKTNLKKLAILQYLLLLLRLLFLLFLILAFAQPRWQTNSDINFSDKNVLIALDNSFSTFINSKEAKTGTHFLDVFSNLKKSDNSQTIYELLTADKGKIREIQKPLVEIKSALNEIHFVQGDLYSLLKNIKRSTSSTRETIILVYSDLQYYLERDSLKFSQLFAKLSNMSNIYFVNFELNEAKENGIKSIYGLRYENKPSSAIDMEIETISDDPAEITFYHDQSRIAQKFLREGNSHKLRIEMGNKKIINGTAELESDRFEADNNYYWGIDLSHPAKMLFAGDSASLNLIKSVLSVDEFSQNIKIKSIASRELYAQGGSEWDWLFLSPDMWSIEFSKLIKRFKNLKTKIFLVPGKNQNLFIQAVKSLTGLNAEVVEFHGDEQAGVKNESFSSSLSGYPIRAFVQTYFKVNSKALLKFDNDFPLVGFSGGYYYLSASPDKSNGNILLHPGLPIWFLNWIPGHSRVNSFYPMVDAGKDTTLKLPNNWRKYQQISLTAPQGKFVLEMGNGQVTIAKKYLRKPGNYTLYSGEDEFRFSVNISAKEFEENFLSIDKRYILENDFQATRHIDLWKFALLLALLFLAAETFVRYKYRNLTE